MKFLCKCGHTMVFQTDHLPYDLRLTQSDLIGDLFDESINEIVALESLNEASLDIIIDKHDSAINMNSLKVMKCPVCERLHIQKSTESPIFQSYIKESD